MEGCSLIYQSFIINILKTEKKTGISTRRKTKEKAEKPNIEYRISGKNRVKLESIQTGNRGSARSMEWVL
jgi:hypothetical protein